MEQLQWFSNFIQSIVYKLIMDHVPTWNNTQVLENYATHIRRGPADVEASTWNTN